MLFSDLKLQIISNYSNYHLKMSLTSPEMKEIKNTLTQILHNQTAMMAQIVLMNKLQQPNMNSALNQSFHEGLKSKFFVAAEPPTSKTPPAATPAERPTTVGPPKRKAELPLDSMVNTTNVNANKHRRALSQKPEDVVVDENNDENVAAAKDDKKKVAKSVEDGGGEKIYQKLEPLKKPEKETTAQNKDKRHKKRDFDMELAEFEEKYGSIIETPKVAAEVGGDRQNQRGGGGPGKGKGRGRGRQSRDNNGSGPAGPSISRSLSTNKQGGESSTENDDE